MARKKKETVGFVGIENRVTGIAKKISDLRSAMDSERPRSAQVKEPAGEEPAVAPIPTAPASTPSSSQTGWNSQPSNLGRNILIAGAVIVVLYIIFSGGGGKKSKTSPTSYSSSSYTKPTSPSQTDAVEEIFSKPPPTDFFTSPSGETRQVAKSYDEVMPPTGSGHSLSIYQVRYCLYEKERIEGMRNAINAYSDIEVTSFNVAVEDYNSRCGSFRYRRGTLESVQSELASKRSTLRNEGMLRIFSLR